MGYLTTIVFHNDVIEQTTKDSDELASLIRTHAKGGEDTRELNGIKLFNPMNSDENTLYVHSGNTVVEMCHYSNETEKLIKENPEFFNEMINYLKEEIKNLEDLYSQLHSGA